MTRLAGIVLWMLIGLVAPAASASTFTLTWLEGDATLSIDMERSVDQGVTFTPIILLPAGTLTWLDTDLAAGMTYCYRVRSTNGTDVSDYSNIVCATVLGPPPPAPDVLPPIISITSPSTPTVQRHTRVQVDATGTDDIAMASLQLAIGASALCTIYGTETTLDASCGWNVPAAANRTYTISVVATDRAGNVARAARSVTAR